MSRPPVHPSRTVAEAMRVVVRLKNGPEIKDVLERVQVVQGPWSLGTTLSWPHEGRGTAGWAKSFFGP